MTTDDWQVGIIWLTRHLQRPDRMLRRRYRATMRRRDKERADDSRGALEGLDGCAGVGDLGDLGGIVAVLAVVAAIALVIALGPGLLAVTVGLAEIALVLLGATIALAGRVLFGQPWEIVARRGSEQIAWRVKGVRRAREMTRRIEQQLNNGIEVERIEPADRDRTPPNLSDVPNLYGRGDFALLGRFYGALIAGALLVGAVILAVR